MEPQLPSFRCAVDPIPWAGRPTFNLTLKLLFAEFIMSCLSLVEIKTCCFQLKFWFNSENWLNKSRAENETNTNFYLKQLKLNTNTKSTLMKIGCQGNLAKWNDGPRQVWIRSKNSWYHVYSGKQWFQDTEQCNGKILFNIHSVWKMNEYRIFNSFLFIRVNAMHVFSNTFPFK